MLLRSLRVSRSCNNGFGQDRYCYITAAIPISFYLLNADSDLEYELEPCPPIGGETSAEAAACVKVLIASGLSSDSSLTNSSMVEAPLTINIPNLQSSRISSENSQPTCSIQGMNITVPVSVQKQILPAVATAETLEGNESAGANLPARRKRKPWSEAEDMELISAVQKIWNLFLLCRNVVLEIGQTSCEETSKERGLLHNWLRVRPIKLFRYGIEGFLDWKWTIIKKRVGNLNVEGNSIVPQLSEAQLATRSALSLALDMPDKNLTAACTNNPGLKITSSTSALPTTGVEASVQLQSQFQQGPIASSQSQNHSQQGSITSVLSHNQPQKAPVIPIPSHNEHKKGLVASCVPAKNLSQQVHVASVQVPNPSQQGPMIMKSSPLGSSGSTLKSQACLKNPPTYFSGRGSILDATAVAAGARIGGSSVKPVIPSGPSSHLEVQSSTSHPGSPKSAAQRAKYTTTSSLNLLIQQCNGIASSPTVEGSSKEESEAAVCTMSSASDSLLVEHVRENGAHVLKNKPGEGVKEQKEAV
ncbi:uncharacterized protein LOC120208914 [Hibiscus syriacus]|uniref:uncharacterized protein LOC120208914 n=1 Tax=Hibiscus syriacus TaxID=106335 RepID=UPI0019245E76|nr:uncharacterized protein LOC120208914 [Hibiscus syriacus]